MSSISNRISLRNWSDMDGGELAACVCLGQWHITYRSFGARPTWPQACYSTSVVLDGRWSMSWPCSIWAPPGPWIMHIFYTHGFYHSLHSVSRAHIEWPSQRITGLGCLSCQRFLSWVTRYLSCCGSRSWYSCTGYFHIRSIYCWYSFSQYIRASKVVRRRTSLVHSIMYTYYAFRAFSIGFRR